MNATQKKIIIGGATLFLLMGLFPPWSDVQDVGGLPYSTPVGYGLIFSPPAGAEKIDLARLQIQWFMVIAVCAVVAFTLGDGKRDIRREGEYRDDRTERRNPNDRRDRTERRDFVERRVNYEHRDLEENRRQPERRSGYDRRRYEEDRISLNDPLRPERRRIPERRLGIDRRHRTDTRVKRERRMEPDRRDSRDRRLEAPRRTANDRRTPDKPSFLKANRKWFFIFAGVLTVALLFLLLMPYLGPSKLRNMTVTERLQFRRMVSEASIMRTFRGHEGFIRSVDFSPDSRFIATGSYDQTIKIWDMGNGLVTNTLIGHTDKVSFVQFSPNEEYLASAGFDKMVIIWDYKTGQIKHSLDGHFSRVRCLDYSPRDNILASGSSDRTIKIWDTETGDILKTLEGHFDEVWSVQFSPDGSMLASGSQGERVGQIIIWDVRTGRQITRFDGYDGNVLSLDFSPNGQFLAAGSGIWNEAKQVWLDGKIAIWDVAQNKLIHTMKQKKVGAFISLAFGPEGKIIASGNNDRTITLWDASRGKPVKSLKGHAYFVASVVFNKEGTLLVSSSGERQNKQGEIKIWGPFNRSK